MDRNQFLTNLKPIPFDFLSGTIEGAVIFTVVHQSSSLTKYKKCNWNSKGKIVQRTCLVRGADVSRIVQELQSEFQ